MSFRQDRRLAQPNARVLAFLPDRREREAIEQLAAGHHDLRICTNGDDGLAALRTGTIGAIIWDIGGARAIELAAILRTAGQAGIMIPTLLLRVDLRRLDAHGLLRIVVVVSDLQVSLRRVDDIVADATALLNSAHEPTPECSILRCIGTRRLTPAMQIVIAAILVGKRRTTVSVFASLRQMPQRTMEDRVKSEKLPPLKDLLGWSVALWTSWRRGVLLWPPRRIVAASRFESPEAEANYIERHTGARPHQIEQNGGFAWLLELFATLVPSGR